MLLATRPGYRQRCRYARRGCTCFYFDYGRTANWRDARRRAARKAEKARWRRGADT